ncbi:MAG: hypothetical protein AAGN46_12135 [Acidobacteriota bacterium]
MLYLIGQIFICLLIAALLGGLIGWWLRGIRCRQATEELRATLHEDFESERVGLLGEIDAAASRIDVVASELTEATTALEERESELAAAHEAHESALAAAGQKQEAALKAALDELEASLGAEHASALSAAQEEHEASLKSALEERETVLKAAQTLALTTAGNEHEASLKLALEEREGSLAAEHSEALEAARAEHDASLRAALEEREASLAAAHASALDSLRQEHESALEVALAEQKDAQASVVAGSADEIDSLRAEIDSLRLQLDACQNARTDLQAQVSAAAGGAALGLLSNVKAEKPEAPDDLKVVEGIGPKIERLLNDDGVWTWEALAVAAVERLQRILDDAGPRYRVHDPATWPRQARLAADGQWQELEEWQDRLKGGRER